MLKINAHTRLKLTAGGDSGFPAPTSQGPLSAYEDQSSDGVFASEDDAIAPAMDFKEKNEKALEKQQDDVSKSEDHPEPTKATARLRRSV